MAESVFTVSDLNRYIKGLLDSEEALRDLWVRGELSNFRHYQPSGHMYFTLKDDRASLRCVMFRSHASRVRFTPESGMGVLARGSVSIYERDGQYQLYVVEMEPEGVGALHLALEQLKKRLSAEGLFDDSLKKPLPLLPRRIGVVTSARGAALRDIIQVTGRRFPRREIVLAPAQVQGEGAAADIARALRDLDGSGLVDVIIVGRGGGSLEDLWAFNEEPVARAIYECRVPVVSAVGHETDFTIADLVADVRAPTPSAAAELVIPSRADIVASLSGAQSRLGSLVQRLVKEARRRLVGLSGGRALTRPATMLDSSRQLIDAMAQRLHAAFGSHVTSHRHSLTLAASRLDDLSPLSVLARGYSICTREDGSVLTRASEVDPGTRVKVILAAGRLACVVNAVDEEGGR